FYKIIKKIKNIIPSIIPEVGFKCKQFGHWYGNGTMYGKQFLELQNNFSVYFLSLLFIIFY
ncbi:MAG: hypothetical protein M1168_03660, partial [Candidatus Marsarchaeota archaeon]|nr:hypothetical protein [Candidatus Marsarchaeota archaeon]